MGKQLKLRRPGHATVVAYLALFVALGGSAYAASHLGRNSVGTKQLKKNAVTAKKIKKNAVTGAKVKDRSLTGSDLADGTITGTKVADGSLSGVDIDQTSLTSVRASNVIGIAMNSDCTAVVPFPSGVSTATAGTGCEVSLPSSVLNCTATATVGFRTRLPVLPAERTVQTLRSPDAPNEIETFPRSSGVSTAQPVDLMLVC